MVACEAQSLRPQGAETRKVQKNVRLGAYALMAGAACLVLVCAALTSSSPAVAPQQDELIEMWSRPYTTMLWNAASDDADGGDSNQGFSEDADDDSSSYTAFDTDSYGSDDDHSGEQGDIDSDLKDILPSSELKGDDMHSSNQWDTSDLSSHDDWDSHDDSNSLSSSSKWGGQDLSAHSWDSSENSQMKSELRKMYHNGIDKIPKSVAEKAAKEASGGFFAKWAKLTGKKVASGKKYGLSNEQAKLYKDAEASEQKEEAKKAKYVKAVHKAAAKDAKADAKKGAKNHLKAKHAADVKHKLQAADKMAASLSHKKHAAHKALAKKAKKNAVPKKEVGEIGNKEAVHKDLANLKSAHGAKAKAAARKKMAELEKKIKDDFNTVTKFAHQVKTSLPPLKMKQ